MKLLFDERDSSASLGMTKFIVISTGSEHNYIVLGGAEKSDVVK